MKKVIQHLRNKPEHVRRNILHAASIGITALIVIFWLYTLKVHFSSPETEQSFANDLKPLTVIKNDVTDTYQQASSDLGQQTNQ